MLPPKTSPVSRETRLWAKEGVVHNRQNGPPKDPQATFTEPRSVASSTVASSHTTKGSLPPRGIGEAAAAFAPKDSRLPLGDLEIKGDHFFATLTEN